MDAEHDAKTTTGRMPQRFDMFLIEREIWHGLHSTVYMARDMRDHATVALKVLYPQGDKTLGQQRWCAQLEASRLRDIAHPNIIELRKHGEWQGVPYLSFPFIEGDGLDKALEKTAPQAAPDAGPGTHSVKCSDCRPLLSAMAKVARALHHAHTKGVIHRDLKPKNILIDKRGEPRVLDWGLSWRKNEASKSGFQHIVGTPAYMSPEQARGEEKKLTPATDIYSVGTIMYHVVTGRPPFEADTTWKTLQMTMSLPPRPPSGLRSTLDLRMERIILTCLEKLPDDRYESARSLADDIERVLKDTTPKGPAGILGRLLER
jgi:serine/threonine-protein kinase